jgi:hypothetical protein
MGKNKAKEVEDIEDVSDDEECEGSSVIGMISDIFKSINYKSAFALFLLFLFVNTESFVQKVVGRFSGTLTSTSITNYGIIIQALSLVVMFIVADGLIKRKVF